MTTTPFNPGTASSSIWRDRMQRGGTESLGSEAWLGHTRISIHRHIDTGPDVWLLSCYELQVVSRELVSHHLDAAKGEAVKFLRAKLDRHMKDLGYIEARTP